MAVYDIKDRVSTCKTSKALVNTGKMKKRTWLSCVLILQTKKDKEAFSLLFYYL